MGGLAVDHLHRAVDFGENTLERRAFLKGGMAAAMGTTAALAFPGMVSAAGTGGGGMKTSSSGTTGARPVPPVIRSRQDLIAKGATFSAVEAASAATSTATLPITQDGTTYAFAQETTWLDSAHFAVGRWDGSMSIFTFETAPFVGPLMNRDVNDPSSQGVQMITSLPGNALATSNDSGSIILWASNSGNWTDLQSVQTYTYDPTLDVATNGVWVSAGSPSTLVVGHASGYISLWSYNSSSRQLRFLRAINLQNPNPVNPFNGHSMYGMAVIVDARPLSYVVTGSDDGYVSIVEVPTGRVLSQTVYSPIAQRGINSVSVQGTNLLVANCSVGPSDFNLWYYSINESNWTISLIDRVNLIINTQRAQVFNFDAIWGQYSGGRCWFASTEEGALWMGTADTSLHVIGYEQLTPPLGAALAYRGGPGRLVMVAYDLDQFSTGGA
jgi:WD40 repeat protein